MSLCITALHFCNVSNTYTCLLRFPTILSVRDSLPKRLLSENVFPFAFRPFSLSVPKLLAISIRSKTRFVANQIARILKEYLCLVNTKDIHCFVDALHKVQWLILKSLCVDVRARWSTLDCAQNSNCEQKQKVEF